MQILFYIIGLSRSGILHYTNKKAGIYPCLLDHWLIGLTKDYFVGEMADACIPFGPASTSK